MTDAAPVLAAAAKVVVVDDSPSVCRAIERMLRPLELTVVGLHGGAEALARLEDERPELVLCDLVLPDLDGLEICRFVRASAVLREVPVIAISSLASDEARRRAAEAGADALLKKPFRADALLAQIAALLGPGRSPGRLAQPAAQPAAQPTALPATAEPEPPPPAEFAALPGLLAGRWRLAGGGTGRFPASRSGPAAPAPAAALAVLSRLALSVDGGEPEMLAVEGIGGETVLVVHAPDRGVVTLRLRGPANLGRARHLARKFLSAANLPDRKEPRPWDP